MRALVLVNTNTAGSKMREIRRWAQSRSDIGVRGTADNRDAQQAVRDAIEEGLERLIVAGGDGSLHVVANELLERTAEKPSPLVLGLVPVGTGNDLARTLRVPFRVQKALEVAADATPTCIDVLRGHRRKSDASMWIVNAAAGGFSGDVDLVVTRKRKDRWGALAFLVGAAEVASEMKEHEVNIRFTGRVENVGEPGDVTTAVKTTAVKGWAGTCVNIVCANGRTIGGGRRVAPVASLTDARMDVVIVRSGPLRQLAGAATKLLTGSWLDHPLIDHFRADRVDITADPGLLFNVDGELWTDEPIQVEVVHEALYVAGGAVGSV
jgi:diacylglycerol kinase (ATP)